MRLGLGIPTCRDGVAYSPGFATPAVIADLAMAAEGAGYNQLWGNQHLLTQDAVAALGGTPPNYFDPMVVMSFLAAVTDHVELVFATLVAPVHHPLVLGKQLATLDQMSNGRVIAGFGLGAYVEESQFMARPGTSPRHRGRTMDELLQALRILFTSHDSSFAGTEFGFTGVQSYPKPVRAMPFLTSGDSAAGISRAARLADGLVVANRRADQVPGIRESLHQQAAVVGRTSSTLQVAVQQWVCVADSDTAAERKLVNTQHFRRLEHLSGRPRSELIDEFRQENMLGTEGPIVDGIRTFAEVGTDHLALIFLGSTPNDVQGDAVAVGNKYRAGRSSRLPANAVAQGGLR